MATSGAFHRTIWRGLARQLFVGKRWYSQSEPVKLFSELRDLHPSIVEKLTQQKLLELTDIQSKVPISFDACSIYAITLCASFNTISCYFFP